MKYGVKIGKKSRVYTNSFFGGRNAVFGNVLIYNSSIGLCTYISDDSKIRWANIGKFCSVADNLNIGMGQHPSRKFVSTHPAFYSLKLYEEITFSKEQKFEEHSYVDSEKKYVVEIGNDVWIGSNVLIMDGIKIGDGAIIGAGAVVTKDVPDYAIVGGVPAKLIRYRFMEEQVKFLKDFKWWNKDFDWIKNNYEDFDDIEEFINKYNNN